ncbi:MAG: 4-(cytidine 5'-diphospho)-2-C-methyl-D-erythritol kinase [Gemmatimonadetes bacterium]|nr:4-(cytidine 5'-diphospho)-2-C-methyl-D-erythritol kinase [Gemmatimonadota bacterium]MDA1104226.1 4-(cytidine 5'-diphospho)-2-C-methyl-D-erythritol kinase [Gemmatimonadota bacterium]
MSRVVVVDAPAKVNLFLRVLHRREDGYRELETLFQAVSLADEIRLSLSSPDGRPARGGGTVTLEVDGPDLGPVESNLAFRAAALFQQTTGLDADVHIHLTKRIPAGAGLGGGSSDAAAVLRGLASLVDFVDHESLATMGTHLGSDVPFFLGSASLALGRGRGDVLAPLPPLPELSVVLALPPVHVSTAEAYGAVTGSRARSGTPDGEVRPNALFEDLDWERVQALVENDFDAVVSDQHPEIGASLEGLRAEGARCAVLSGSGSASFGLFAGPAQAERAANVLTSRLGWRFLHVTTRI